MIGRSFRGRHRAGARVGLVGPIVVAGLIAGALAACGGDSGDAGPVQLSAAGVQGQALASAKGCAGCHRVDGKNAAGPSWKGILGTEVTLQDNSKVVVDTTYLTESIKDPWVKKVKGYSTIMPRNSLTDAEVASIVTYIEELSPTAK